MDIKDKIKQIKVLLSMEEAAKFADYKTSDGTILRCTNLATGEKVMMVSEAGETPAKDGSYELDNGKVIKVAQGAIVDVVEKPEAKEGEATPAKMENEFSKIISEFKTQIEEIKAQFAELKTGQEKFVAEYNAKHKSEIESKLSAVQEQNKEMFSIIEKILNMPAAEPTDKPKEPTKQSFLKTLRSEVKESRENRKKIRFN